MRNFKGFIVIIVLIFFAAVFVNGCSKTGGSEKKPTTSSEQKTTPPPALKTLLTDLDTVMLNLQKIIQEENAPPSSTGGQSSGGDGQSQGQSSEQQGGGGSQEQSGQQEQSSGESTADPQKMWSEIENKLTSIHRDWNMLESQVMMEGLDTATRDSFEQALARLTESIDGKNSEESLFAALDVYKYYPDMVELFDNKTPADFYRVKYEVMMIGALAFKKDWVMADEHVSPMQDAWDNLKKDEKLKSEKDMVKQTENSLEDIELAVDMEDTKLVQIKSSIALDNLDQVEKAFTSQS